MLCARLEVIDTPKEAVATVRAALERAGASLEASAEIDALQPSVLVVERLSATWLGALRELSARGSRRLLVLTTDAEPLDRALCLRALASGAADVLRAADPCAAAAAVARLARWHEVDQLIESREVREHVVGSSAAFRAVLRQVVETARFTRASVLLLGESGTGKEQLAKVLHALDPRQGKGELVTLDCSTIVGELSGSELFGHERGAFTGAVSARDGAFALAHRGTLFLDEVGELPAALQAQLLRVVQEGTFKRVGGNQWLRSDFRLISATHRSLEREVEAGAFRLDLYHRLATYAVRIPPLRERPEDVAPLARAFAQRALGPARQARLDPMLEELLAHKPYRGNVRELKHLVERMCGRHVADGLLTLGDLAPSDWPAEEEQAGGERDLELAVGRAVCRGLGLQDIKRVAREAALGKALELGATPQAAAKLLKTTERTMQTEISRRANGGLEQ